MVFVFEGNKPAVDISRNIIASTALKEGAEWCAFLDDDVVAPPNWIQRLRQHNLPICYDNETEILTLMGFKKFSELTFNDKIATLNPETEEIEYFKPVEIQKLFYAGEMIQIGGKGCSTDLLVTPDHSLYCRVNYYNTPTRKFEFIKAIDFYRQHHSCKFEFKRNAKWSCMDIEYFEPPKTGLEYLLSDERLKKYKYAMELRKRGLGSRRTSKEIGIPEDTVEKWFNQGTNPVRNTLKIIKKIPINLWLELLGWWLSEGCVSISRKRRSYRIRISNSDEKNLKEIEETIRKIGYTPNRSDREVEFKSIQIARYLKSLLGSPIVYPNRITYAGTKTIPLWVKNLPPRRLRHLFNTMMRGDGSKNFRNNSWYYSTKSKALADDFQEILLKIGLSGTIHKTKDGLYNIQIVRKKFTPLSKLRPKIVNYKGYVYDVTMPKNHIILVRRNGKIVWSGNCSGLYWRRHPDGTWPEVFRIDETGIPKPMRDEDLRLM